MSHRVVAGFLAGSSAGLIKKSGMWGFNVGLLFGIAAVIRKEMGFKGYELIPTTVRVSGSSVLLSVVVTVGWIFSTGLEMCQTAWSTTLCMRIGLKLGPLALQAVSSFKNIIYSLLLRRKNTKKN